MHEYSGLDDFPRARMWQALEDYRDAREVYWSATDHEDIMRRAYDEMALMFMKVVTTLVTGSVEPGGNDWRAENENRWTWFLRQLDQHDEVAILFDQAIEMSVYESVMERLEGSRERCLQLASLVLSTRPSEPVERYLGRLSACYISGLLPECVILCRALLENAVSDVFQRHGIPLPQNEEGVSAMHTRLKAAHMLGWLSADGLAGAKTIWLRGNKAVHQDPDATRDVFGTVVLTGNVLSELYHHG
jgi:hypothetical protein